MYCYKRSWVHLGGGLWYLMTVFDAACGRPNWT
nr:MAG TPA: hypothetical protein [Caudoviricetes sp.]